ncbi:hypothetical protein B0T17DRAFT_87995 [Bombardia bombarda]|uniref:Uncharacterized protein n=1 Tax=Bombardia bombarda TaxID=252184 RepID=A0AA39XME0_9PEZI|nr:hypothetical protein B0T17DRAFT_87995 [Bombardia bombarda]
MMDADVALTAQRSQTVEPSSESNPRKRLSRQRASVASNLESALPELPSTKLPCSSSCFRSCYLSWKLKRVIKQVHHLLGSRHAESYETRIAQATSNHWLKPPSAPFDTFDTCSRTIVLAASLQSWTTTFQSPFGLRNLVLGSFPHAGEGRTGHGTPIFPCPCTGQRARRPAMPRLCALAISWRASASSLGPKAHPPSRALND